MRVAGLSETAQDRQLHEGGVFVVHMMLRFAPMIGTQNAEDRDLVTALEFRTAQAILPGFQR